MLLYPEELITCYIRKNMKYTCPCCGYKTLDEEPPGTFDICPICYWEDDNIQFADPDYAAGANKISLRQAQKNYFSFGAAEKRFQGKVRSANKADEKDQNWHPLT
jgi:hypothetical protein